MQHRLVHGVGEDHILKYQIPADWSESMGASRIAELVALVKNLHSAVETGHSFGELRPDVYDLEDGRNHEGQQRSELEVAADGHTMGEHSVTSQQHNESADNTEHGGRGKGQRAGCGERAHDIIEQALHA